MLGEVATMAESEGADNVAFVSYLLLGLPDAGLQMLLNRKRFAEAAIFARYVCRID